MSSYRQAPAPEPLFLTFGWALLAIDPGGALLWQIELGAQPQRLFRIGNHLILVVGTQVLRVDLAEGKMIGAIDLPFEATTGLVHESGLYLAGASGAARIDPTGSIVWVAAQHAATQTWSFDFSLRCADANGAELWCVNAGPGGPPGLAMGDTFVQPDITS